MKNLRLLPSTLFAKPYPPLMVITTCGKAFASEPSYPARFSEQRISLWFIQKLMGHSSSKTKAIYTQLLTEEIRKIKTLWMIFIKQKVQQYIPIWGVLLNTMWDVKEINILKGVYT